MGISGPFEKSTTLAMRLPEWPCHDEAGDQACLSPAKMIDADNIESSVLRANG